MAQPSTVLAEFRSQHLSQSLVTPVLKDPILSFGTRHSNGTHIYIHVGSQHLIYQMNEILQNSFSTYRL